MSLSQELADAVAKSFGAQNTDRTKIDQLGKDMSDAIVNFITKQPFEIKEMKAVVELEKVQAEGLDADVKPSTLLGPYQPIFDFLKKLKPALDLVTNGAYGKSFGKLENAVKAATQISAAKGARTKDIDLKKDEGLESKGYTYIGGSDVDDENLGTVSVIQLERDKVVDA